MSNLTDFFPVPTGGGDSAIVTDPTKLPFICTTSWVFSKKDNVSKYSGGNEFWEVVENYGVRAVMPTTSDTYKTVADVTGSGYFNYSISPASATTNGIVTARFTIDGVVTEISLAVNKYGGYTTGRAIIGAYCVGRASSINETVGFGNYSSDVGYVPNQAKFPTSGEYQSTNITILRPDFFNFPGAPKLRFETSFKLEYKTSNYSSADYNNYTGVSYKLD